MEYAAAAVVRVRAHERARWRDPQIDRRRFDLAAADGRLPSRRDRTHRHRRGAVQSAARVRRGRLPGARSHRTGTAAPAPGRPAPPPPGQGGVFRSDDAGATWRRVGADQALWGRGWYFEKIAVDPRDPDIVYVPNVAVNRSRDGGVTWDVIRGSPGGDDYHQVWISPDNPDILIVASDQGAI